MQHNTRLFVCGLLRRCASTAIAAAAMAILPLASISCDTGAKDVYVAGYESAPNVHYSEGSTEQPLYMNVAAVWKNDAILYRLGDGKDWSWANSVVVSDKDVYVAGYDGGTATVWKNGMVMYRLGKGNARSLYVVGPDVYVTGEKETVQGFSPAVWKNGTEYTNNALSLCISGKDVYVAVGEKDGRNSVIAIQKNGVVEHRLNNGGYNVELASLCVSDKDVYAAGVGKRGTRSWDDSVAIMWKNGAALRLGDEGRNSHSYAKTVYVSGEDVYVMGQSESTLSTIWKNGTVLYRLGEGDDGGELIVALLGESGKDVYAQGKINGQHGDFTNIWKNGVRLDGVDSFCVSGKDVYLAGRDGDFATIRKNDKVLYRVQNGWAGTNAIFVTKRQKSGSLLSLFSKADGEVNANANADANGNANGNASNLTNGNVNSNAEVQAGEITLATGASFSVAASSTVSSKTAKAGDAFEGTLSEDIFEGNRMVATKGSIVKGMVVGSDPGGPIDGPAKLSIQITQLTLADGQTIPIKTSVYTATGKISKDSAAVGIEAALRASRAMSDAHGAGTVDIAALEKAQSTPATVAKGAPIAFKLTQDLTFTLRN